MYIEDGESILPESDIGFLQKVVALYINLIILCAYDRQMRKDDTAPFATFRDMHITFGNILVMTGIFDGAYVVDTCRIVVRVKFLQA
jgi:hypothetical protein